MIKFPGIASLQKVDFSSLSTDGILCMHSLSIWGYSSILSLCWSYAYATVVAIVCAAGFLYSENNVCLALPTNHQRLLIFSHPSSVMVPEPQGKGPVMSGFHLELRSLIFCTMSV